MFTRYETTVVCVCAIAAAITLSVAAYSDAWSRVELAKVKRMCDSNCQCVTKMEK